LHDNMSVRNFKRAHRVQLQNVTESNHKCDGTDVQALTGP